MSPNRVDFRVAGLDCESEASAIKRGMSGVQGVVDLQVYVKSAKVGVTFDPSVVAADDLKSKLNELGFAVQEGGALAHQPKPWRNPKIISSAISGLLLLAGYLVGIAGASALASNYRRRF